MTNLIRGIAVNAEGHGVLIEEFQESKKILSSPAS